MDIKRRVPLHKGSGERMSTFEITFAKPFEVKPDVVININTLDAEKYQCAIYCKSCVYITRWFYDPG